MLAIMTALEFEDTCASLRLFGEIIFNRARLNLIRDAECARRIETVVRTPSGKSLFVAECYAAEWIFIEYKNGSNEGVEFAEPLRGELVKIAPDVVLTIMRAVEAACGWPDVIDEPRAFCAYCGKPIPNMLEFELFPGGEGAWLCWDEGHQSQISGQLKRYFDFLHKSCSNDSAKRAELAETLQSFLRKDNV